jgi:hypothetical protein
VVVVSIQYLQMAVPGINPQACQFLKLDPISILHMKKVSSKEQCSILRIEPRVLMTISPVVKKL